MAVSCSEMAMGMTDCVLLSGWSICLREDAIATAVFIVLYIPKKKKIHFSSDTKIEVVDRLGMATRISQQQTFGIFFPVCRLIARHFLRCLYHKPG